MKKIIIFCLISILLFGCSANKIEPTPSPIQKIEHTYFNIGEKVEEYNAIYTINRTIKSDLKSREGFHWIIIDIDFYNDSDDDEDIPLCVLSVNKSYYNGYAQPISLPKRSRVNTRVLFEIPDNETEFNFFTDDSYSGSDIEIDDYSRSIVRIKL